MKNLFKRCFQKFFQLSTLTPLLKYFAMKQKWDLQNLIFIIDCNSFNSNKKQFLNLDF